MERVKGANKMVMKNEEWKIRTHHTPEELKMDKETNYSQAHKIGNRRFLLSFPFQSISSERSDDLCFES